MGPRVHRLRAIILGPEDQSARTLRVRVQVWLTTLLVVTNVIGAIIVVLLNYVIIPGGGPSRDLLDVLYVAVPAYVLAAVVVGVVLITRYTLRELAWALTDATPTSEQRTAALKLPWRITLVQFGLWMAAAVLFTAIASIAQPEAMVPTFAAITIAGIVVSAIAYLNTEYVLRPIAGRALADRGELQVQLAGVQRRMIVFWFLGTAAPTLGLVVAGYVALTRPEDVSLRRFAFAILSLAAVLIAFGLLVTLLNAQAVVNPITSVRSALTQVQKGRFDTRVTVNDATELGLLQAGFNDMAAGLEERERIRDLFGRHVGESVAAAATTSEAALGGETRVVTVLMIDIIGSTGYATDRDPTEVVDMLNRFFGVIVEEVDRHQGLVNKFMGDAVLAIFGSPVHLDDHAGAALAAARAIATRMADEVPEVGAGIGVSTGEAVAGNVGSASRFEFTVIGDAVNAAARLTELAKEAPGHVLVARRSVDEASTNEQPYWRDHGEEVLRGRRDPTELAVMADAD